LAVYDRVEDVLRQSVTETPKPFTQRDLLHMLSATTKVHTGRDIMQPSTQMLQSLSTPTHTDPPRARWRFAGVGAALVLILLAVATFHIVRSGTQPARLAASSLVFYSAPNGALDALNARTGQRIWTFAQPDYAAFASAIDSQRIYVWLSQSSNCQPCTLSQIYALDLQTGKALWHTGPAALLPPVVSGATIYLYTSQTSNYLTPPYHVMALAADTGRVRWSVPVGNITIGNPLPPASGTNIAPLISNDTAYVGEADGSILALNAATGQQQWHSPAQPGSNAIILMLADGDVLYAMTGAGTVFALHRADGTLLWNDPAATVCQGTPPCDSLNTRLIHADGLVFFETRISLPTRSIYETYTLHAIADSTGKEIWHYDDARVAGDIGMSDPLFANGILYITDQEDSVATNVIHTHILALQPATGKILWDVSLMGSNTAAMAPFLDGNRILYPVSDQGSMSVYAVARESGQVLWQSPSFPVAANATPMPLYVMLADAYLIEAPDASNINILYAFDPNNGHLLWRYPPAP